jgi:hypothetical protein
VVSIAKELSSLIAGCWFDPGRETMVALEEAAVAVASLDVTAGTRMAAISGFLLRGEAVSSSKIEHVNANRVMLACLRRYSADGRFRCRLVAARCSFEARRRRFEPRVGLVARRRAASGASPSATRSESLARAVSRLRS